MTRAYRSTTLSLMARHCAAAGSHHEHGTREDSSIFQVGIAAHAALQAVAQARLRAGAEAGPLLPEEVEAAVRAATLELIEHGRSFDGRPEPPMPAELAWQGAEVALEYMRRAGPPAGDHVEVGLAVDREWRLVPYDSPDARLRCILDLVGDAGSSGEEWLMGDDDSPAVRMLEVTDYKSSWRAGAGELDSTQRKVQALLAWQAFGEPGGYQGIKLTVANLRTGVPHSIELYPAEPEGAATLDRWRADLDAEMQMRDRQVGADGWRAASPGAGCVGCPYLHSCPPAQAAIARGKMEDPRDEALRLAVLTAEVERIGKAVRGATKEEPIEVPGGFVGYKGKPKRVPVDDAPQLLWKAWKGRRVMRSAEEVEAHLLGLLRKLAPGVGQIEDASQIIRQGRKREDVAWRRAWIAEMTREVLQAEFGVYRAPQEEESDGE